MASALSQWRRRRRENAFWVSARNRSSIMPRAEIVGAIDVSLMAAGQAITRFRQAADGDMQDIQLHELRMQLEACLGMLDNLLPES